MSAEQIERELRAELSMMTDDELYRAAADAGICAVLGHREATIQEMVALEQYCAFH